MNNQKTITMWIRDPKTYTFSPMKIEAKLRKTVGDKVEYSFIHPITKQTSIGRIDKTFWEV